MKTKSFILLAAVIGLIFSSCRKSATLEESGVEAANDATYSETLFDDVFSTLDIATLYLESASKSEAKADSCPAINITVPEGSLWPKTLTIDYGTSCTGLDNIVRSGKILIILTAPRSQEGSVRTITFDNYYFNYAKIEGTKTVTNLGLNDNNNVVFSVSLTGGKVTLTDNLYFTCESQREREYISGFNTKTFWDDECLITGYGSGVGINGKNYSYSITAPLDWKAVCRFLISGTVRLEVEGIDPFYLDYGNGNCDNTATLSRGSDTKEITLGLFHYRIKANN